MNAMREFVDDLGAIAHREWLRYRRDRSYWVGQLAFPLLVVAFMGLGLDEVASRGEPLRYSARLAAGLIALSISSGAVGGGYALIEDRRSGFLRALCVAPLYPSAVVLGKILARAGVSALLLLALVALFSLMTDMRLSHAWAAALSLAVLTVSFSALGIGLATRFERAESFRLIAALVTVPLYLLSGMFYTVDYMPDPLRALALVNPLTYGVDLLRYGLLGEAEFDVVRSAWGLAGLAAVALPAAIGVYRQGVRRL